MKPILFHNPKEVKASFYVQEDRVPYFYDVLHFHPEFQLTTIVKGSGTVIIGDAIGRFSPGDVFLIGPNIPHVFRCDQEYYEEDSELESMGVSIYFFEDSMGENFFQLPECEGIKELLTLGGRGIKLNGYDNKSISMKIVSIVGMEGMPRLLTFLNLLGEMQSKKVTKEVLSSMGYTGIVKVDHKDRMSEVVKYLMENFSSEIKLETVANIACMSPTAFCRYFKRKTRKTISTFIMEIRIGYACKLLLEEKHAISDIAFRCGFNNLSNFNRQFKRKMSVSPSSYVLQIAG
jgi:AraC-like DNA-binding protein